MMVSVMANKFNDVIELKQKTKDFRKRITIFKIKFR